ncbi:MAG: FAD binding domain-containing protein [Ignavibacteriales bacterium]|nr:FAD binding domain-containing protein [Ignavibacteriales bacterium]
MIPNIEYFTPKTIAEALQLLSKQENVKIIAGGTDVITGFHQESSRFTKTGALIDINRIPELHQISETTGSVWIGAGCTFTQVVNSPVVQKEFPLLVQASSGVGSLQIRNRATIGGNFVNNAPQSADNSRTMPLQEFLIRPYCTQLAFNEIVTNITLAKLPGSYHGSYYKLGRRRGVAISRITVAALLNVVDDAIADIRFASGAATPIGMRFPEIEALAMNQKVSDDLLRKLAIQTGELVLERTGLRWSTAYKLPVLQQLCYQELFNAVYGKE